MNILKQIVIAGTHYPLIADDVSLDIKRPAKGIFTVQADKKLTGIVSFAIGYNSQQLTQWFLGYIESSTALDKKQQRIVARELGGVLQHPQFLNLRHVTIKDILNTISDNTGLNFVVGEGDYSQTTIPYFYSMGNGFHCLDSLGKSFGIERYFWQQEASNNIFVGSWSDSHWSKKSLDLDNKWLSDFGVGERATLPALPQLRPGVYLKGLGCVDTIRLKEASMLLTWTKRL